MNDSFDLRYDKDKQLIFILLIVLMNENADQKLILALLYILFA